MEIWKDITGYENLYQASNLGRIKSLARFVKRCANYTTRFKKENILKPGKAPNGRLMVVLCYKGVNKGFGVHQLVAMAFLGHVPMGYKRVVDHIDNNPLNNNVENLQIVTQRENISKIKRKTTSKYIGVCRYRDNLWQAKIVIKGKVKFLGHFKKEIEAHKAYQNELKQIKS